MTISTMILVRTSYPDHQLIS